MELEQIIIENHIYIDRISYNDKFVVVSIKDLAQAIRNAGYIKSHGLDDELFDKHVRKFGYVKPSKLPIIPQTVSSPMPDISTIPKGKLCYAPMKVPQHPHPTPEKTHKRKRILQINLHNWTHFEIEKAGWKNKINDLSFIIYKLIQAHNEEAE